jgi:hypothetical protein
MAGGLFESLRQALHRRTEVGGHAYRDVGRLRANG